MDSDKKDNHILLVLFQCLEAGNSVILDIETKCIILKNTIFEAVLRRPFPPDHCSPWIRTVCMHGSLDGRIDGQKGQSDRRVAQCNT